MKEKSRTENSQRTQLKFFLSTSCPAPYLHSSGSAPNLLHAWNTYRRVWHATVYSSVLFLCFLCVCPHPNTTTTLLFGGQQLHLTHLCFAGVQHSMRHIKSFNDCSLDEQLASYLGVSSNLFPTFLTVASPDEYVSICYASYSLPFQHKITCMSNSDIKFHSEVLSQCVQVFTNWYTYNMLPFARMS